MEIEERVVRTIYDLYGNYHFNEKEIADFLNEEKSIFEIISNKIYGIYEIAQRYNEKIGQEIVNLDIELILVSKENIQQKLINPIAESKKKVYKINSTTKECLINDIDNALMLIEKIDEILEKYVIEEYINLIKMDSEYQKNYNNHSEENSLMQQIKQTIENTFIWRKLNDYNDIADLLKENKGHELLQIEDYYTDEMCEIYSDDYNIEFGDSVEDKNEEGLAFENKNLLKILENGKSSDRLKDCIKIVLRSNVVCKKMYDIYYKAKTKKRELAR